jgi:hypothetical protein
VDVIAKTNFACLVLSEGNDNNAVQARGKGCESSLGEEIRCSLFMSVIHLLLNQQVYFFSSLDDMKTKGGKETMNLFSWNMVFFSFTWT